MKFSCTRTLGAGGRRAPQSSRSQLARFHQAHADAATTQMLRATTKINVLRAPLLRRSLSSSADAPVLREVRGAVGLLTLNRPIRVQRFDTQDHHQPVGINRGQARLCMLKKFCVVVLPRGQFFGAGFDPDPAARQGDRSSASAPDRG